MADIPSNVQWIIDSGLSAALLGVLIWVVKTGFSTITQIVEQKDRQIAASNEKYYDLSEKLLSMTERFYNEETDQRDMLIRILTRMEEKLDQPVRCPANINERIGKGDN